MNTFSYFELLKRPLHRTLAQLVKDSPIAHGAETGCSTKSLDELDARTSKGAGLLYKTVTRRFPSHVLSYGMGSTRYETVETTRLSL